jgi:methyl-accepting chemotaxis protein
MMRKETDQAEPPEQIRGRPDLALRITGSVAPGQEKTTSDINDLLDEVGAALHYLFEQGLEQTRISDTLKRDASEMVNAADQTKSLSTQVSAAMNELITAVADIAKKINAGRADADASGADSLRKTDSSLESVKKLSLKISSWAETNKALSQAAKDMSGVMDVLEDIADQTKLLALNAAIQAAQAGDKGRGFAVVADEIKRLAQNTAKYIDEIAGTLKQIEKKAADSLVNMRDTLSDVTESIEKAQATDESLRQISLKASRIAGEVSSNMDSVSTHSENAREVAERIAQSGEAVARSAMDIYSQLCAFKLNEADRTIESFLIDTAGEFEEKLAADVAGGRIKTEDLFDEQYRSDDGMKHRNRATGYFSSVILPKLKEWSSANRRIIYVVVMDRMGFMPTHVKPERAGVIMKDTVSQRGAQSRGIIGQAFRRPIEAGGELVVDISCPIAVMNRHWGCLRIGYLPSNS